MLDVRARARDGARVRESERESKRAREGRERELKDTHKEKRESTRTYLAVDFSEICENFEIVSRRQFRVGSLT